MTNGNSPKIASEIIDAILAYGDARADKDLVKGTASLKKSIELIRSALSVCADGGKGEAVTDMEISVVTEDKTPLEVKSIHYFAREIIVRVAAPLDKSAERADAEKDAARLDWLEQEDEMGFFFNIDHISANINEGFNGFKTLREAIDAAILAATKDK